MLTASEIVKQAFREGNILALNTPIKDDQETEALTLLNSFITSLYGFELGEFAFDWPVPPSATSPIHARFPLQPANQKLQSDVWPYPPGNVRILLALTDDTQLFLDENPNDGARVELVNVGDASSFNLTLNGNGRLVKGAATSVDTPGNFAGQRLLYRADLGDWTLVTTLTAADFSPFPAEYDDLLAIGLVKRLFSRYGRSMTVDLSDTFKRLMRRMKAQYRQPTGSPVAKPNPFRSPAANASRGSTSTRSLF